jgi:hypothetical protein
MPFDGTCEIRRAGIVPDGRALLDLKSSDATFDWHWCYSTPERANEVLAAALTAVAANKLVYCTIDIIPLADQPVVGAFALVK